MIRPENPRLIGNVARFCFHLSDPISGNSSNIRFNIRFGSSQGLSSQLNCLNSGTPLFEHIRFAVRLHSGTPLFEHILGDRLVEGFLDERRDFSSSRAKREFVHISFDEGSIWNSNVGLIVLILCFYLFRLTSV